VTTNRLNTIGPLPEAAPGLETEWAAVTVDASATLGVFPPIQGDISQGAETGDPFFFEEMEDILKEINPQLIRVAPFASIDQVLSKDEDGNLLIDFTLPDRVIASLRRTGVEICWNCASWPEEWRGKNEYPEDLEMYEEFVRRCVERYNSDGSRDIHYIEFWNEPASFNEKAYDAMVRGARAADPGVKVGAPAVMDLKESAIEEALQHSTETGTPLDFISFHLYGKAPWDWPGYIEKAKRLLAKYPGKEDLEIILTEWGLDAGESGVCDTLYNAAYYCSVLEQCLPYWPQVRPTYFEVREGWDWKGPSRDLFGRWGMLTYTNLLPKSVWQAARMWAKMEGDRVEAESSDPRVHVLAAAAPDQVTVLLWSDPRDLWRLEANAPLLHEPSILDIPLEVAVKNIPIRSTGLAYERYQLDHFHSNVNAYPGRTELEKVHEAVIARVTDEEVFQVPLVLPLHGITLLILRPAERAPADVVAHADRYQVWAGESAEVTIQPRMDEGFSPELISDPFGTPDWDIETTGSDPLRLRVTPHHADLRAHRFLTLWTERPDWGAWGRALLEFRTDTPVDASRESWRIDLDARRRKGTLHIPFRNRKAEKLRLAVAWNPSGPLRSRRDESSLSIPVLGLATAETVLSLPRNSRPGRYLIDAVPNTGVDLSPIRTEVFLPIPSRRFRNPPEIDGDLTEWKRIAPVTVSGKENWDGHHLSRYEGAKDLNATIRSGWDDDYLYFAFEVEDDNHYAPVANRAVHEHDCLHLGFDLRRDMLDRLQFFYEDDCDYLFTYTDHGVAYRHWGAKRPEEVPKKVIVGAVQEGNITAYEIALPWEEEFVPYATPDEGRVIGFSVYFRDIDPGEEQGFLHWGRGLDWHTKRPALFWSLQLTGR
jgi:hypothetical protein